MIDDPLSLTAAYAVTSAAFSVTLAKVSPTIGPKLRHGLASAGPMTLVFAYLLEGGDSVTLTGSHMLAAAGLLAAGLASSLSAKRLMRPDHAKSLRDSRFAGPV